MSTKIAPETTATLRITRLIKAPRERVFAAWTTPEEIMKWFGPETCQVLSARVDLRTGGEYRFRVNSPDCAENGAPAIVMEVTGVYREIKQPARLVYTWSWEPKEEFGESIVTVDFLDKEGFTEVQITHDRLPDTEQREKHGHGWNACLDHLQKHIATAGQGNCSAPGTFCWNELMVKDAGAAAKFYTKLFGWQTEEFPGPMKYTMFKQNGQRVGGLMQPSHEAPPHWLAYVEVESVDATVKTAGELGAKVLMPAMDIPTVGRIAIFQDPQGATLGIFQPERK
jgi:uncharacterized protein YndB with AHSA1/START domain/predicted enzyme related to lactoylglutathione lyase